MLITKIVAPGVLVAAGLVAASSALAGPGVLSANVDGTYRQIPKQVTLILEPGRVIASNIRLSRIDPVALQASEVVEQTAEANAVLVVATNQRMLGYGAVVGWREIARLPGETLEAVTVEDFAAFVVTGQRYLNFNADTGLWAAGDRPAG